MFFSLPFPFSPPTFKSSYSNQRDFILNINLLMSFLWSKFSSGFPRCRQDNAKSFTKSRIPSVTGLWLVPDIISQRPYLLHLSLITIFAIPSMSRFFPFKAFTLAAPLAWDSPPGAFFTWLPSLLLSGYILCSNVTSSKKFSLTTYLFSVILHPLTLLCFPLEHLSPWPLHTYFYYPGFPVGCKPYEVSDYLITTPFWHIE